MTLVTGAHLELRCIREDNFIFKVLRFNQFLLVVVLILLVTILNSQFESL